MPSSKNKFLTCSFYLIVLLPFAFPSKAQEKWSVVDNITLSSKILNEDRNIFIQYPKPDKANPTKAYPVLYLLDGESHFNMVSMYCEYLGRWDVNSIPEMIVVGIVNTDRARDLTPTHSIINYFGKADTSSTSWLRTSGGNTNFFKFIHEELMPYVNTHYKTKPFTILAGHSFGGITTIHCLLTQPTMFNAYIAASPSLWWDGEYVIKLANQKISKGSTLNKILFCSDGSEGVADKSSFHTNLIKFDSVMKAKSPTGLKYTYVYYPTESHMTVPLKSYEEGLRFIFSEWSMPPLNNTEVNGAVIKDHYAKLSQRFGYTILPNEKNTVDWATFLMKSSETLGNAISMLEMIAEVYPASFQTFSALGDAYAAKGDKQKAKASYQKALTINPAADEVKVKLKALKV